MLKQFHLLKNNRFRVHQPTQDRSGNPDLRAGPLRLLWQERGFPHWRGP